jgi:hypothetical protein
MTTSLRIRTLIRQTLYRTGRISVEATPRTHVLEALSFLRPKRIGMEMLRVGASGDGGYLVPDDLTGISACFSPGVADAWTFETNLRADFGIPSFLCDRISVPADCPHTFDSFWVGPWTDDQVRSLADWVSDRAPDATSDLLLQMDIEGAEYLTLLACPTDVLKRFRVIVLELHDLHLLATRSASALVFMPLFRRLSRHFVVVHAHANNTGTVDLTTGIDIPELLELTLLRKDRVEIEDGDVHLPHPLDRPNDSSRAEITLSGVWRGSPTSHQP